MVLSIAQWRSGLVVSLCEAPATSSECAMDDSCRHERRVRRAGCATGRWFLRKTALQIVKATIAEASRGDTSGCCKGGDSAEISVWKVVRESFASCEKM